MSNGPPRKPSSSYHFLAGLSTGILSATLLQPADLLKTRVQQSRSTSLLRTLREISQGPNTLRKLWRGTLPSVIRTGLGSALYFSSLNALRQHAARTHVLPSVVVVVGGGGQGEREYYSSSALPRLSNGANVATGAMARAGAGLVLMPVTVIKVRYESSLYAYRSIRGAATEIRRMEGVKGFFSGFGATAIRDAPYAGLYVLFYEQAKRRLSALCAVGESLRPEAMGAGTAVPINFVSGVLAAGLATALTNPFDAVKTRLQLMPGRYGNMVGAGRRMVREEGWRSLMDGVGLRMGRKAVSSALAWTLYEELVRRGEARWVGGEEGRQVV